MPDYMVKGGVTYRILSDHLGSVRLVVNAADGSIAQQIDYDEFGNPTFITGPADFQPFGFAGGLYDADTRLVRFGARDYDPEVGRWTAKDPIGLSDTNLYAYAFSDPVNRIDENARFAHIVGGFVGGALAGGVVGGAVGALREFGKGGEYGDVLKAAGRGAAIGALVGGVTGAAAALGVFTPLNLSATQLGKLCTCGPGEAAGRG